MRKLLIIAACLSIAGAASADTYTSRLSLTLPTIGSLGWGPKISSDMAILDASAAIQGLTNTFTASNTFTGPVLMSGSSITLTGPNGYITSVSSINASAFFGNGYNIGALNAANLTGTAAAINGSNITSLTPGNISAGTAGISVTGNAGTATSPNGTPTTCSAGQAAQGVTSNFNAYGCFTPSGSGNVSTTSTQTFSGTNYFTRNIIVAPALYSGGFCAPLTSATVTGLGSITFSGFSSSITYQATLDNVAHSNSTYLEAQFNGDTGSNYSTGGFRIGQDSTQPWGAGGQSAAVLTSNSTSSNANTSWSGVFTFHAISGVVSIDGYRVTQFDGNGQTTSTSYGNDTSINTLSSIKFFPAAGTFTFGTISICQLVP